MKSIRHKFGLIIRGNVKGKESEYLYFAAGFPHENQPVKDIKNIKFCGKPISEIGDDIECHIYDGTQKHVDEMLSKNVRKWKKNYVLRGIPYLAIKAKFSDKMFDSNTSLTVEADIIS